eukprot:TRINITY_DN7904_c1_g1_i4.p1 TRINITY_DN7904_c1_g1~~TRINITY_DN7904_c1_g1_i4.p1  ORF type:complete len:264 (-),score=-27.93 TRINITY_DN7904_c1_g1_i4:401-1192(-)
MQQTQKCNKTGIIKIKVLLKILQTLLTPNYYRFQHNNQVPHSIKWLNVKGCQTKNTMGLSQLIVKKLIAYLPLKNQSNNIIQGLQLFLIQGAQNLHTFNTCGKQAFQSSVSSNKLLCNLKLTPWLNFGQSIISIAVLFKIVLGSNSYIQSMVYYRVTLLQHDTNIFTLLIKYKLEDKVHYVYQIHTQENKQGTSCWVHHITHKIKNQLCFISEKVSKICHFFLALTTSLLTRSSQDKQSQNVTSSNLIVSTRKTHQPKKKNGS